MRHSGFAGQTPVHTPKGLVPLQTIRAGDLVLSQADGSHERTFQPAVGLRSFPDTFALCLDFFQTVEGWEIGERGGLVAADGQQLWVLGQGQDCEGEPQWKDADNHWGFEWVESIEGRLAWINRSPLYHTPVAGIVWIDGLMDRTRGSGLGRSIDLRGDAILFDYELRPNSPDPTPYSQTTFALELAGSYFVGDWGVRVKGLRGTA